MKVRLRRRGGEKGVMVKQLEKEDKSNNLGIQYNTEGHPLHKLPTPPVHDQGAKWCCCLASTGAHHPQRPHYCSW